jgi:hypothetical protein
MHGDDIAREQLAVCRYSYDLSTAMELSLEGTGRLRITIIDKDMVCV